MNKKLGKAAALVLTGALCVGAAFGMTACGGDSNKTKIGVLVSDNSGSEAVAFRAYYEKYIEKQYDVDFTFTEALADAAAERLAIETFAAQGYKAIISMSDSDRETQIQTCQANEMYYAVASGMLTDAQYTTYKTYSYFLGQIGPDMATEYAAGKAMGEYYKDTVHVESVAIYGGFIPNPMHVYRAAGILEGLDLTYEGESGQAVVGKIFADSKVDINDIDGTINVKSSFQGAPANTVEAIAAVTTARPDVLLSVGMATTFYPLDLGPAGVNYADIDSFTATNVAQMSQAGGKLTYLAGKYASSIGPIFAAVYNAINGNVMRDEDGNAFSIGQGYGIATKAADAEKYQKADSGDSPIINKALLDTVIGKSVTYSAFKTFVETDRTPA